MSGDTIRPVNVGQRILVINAGTFKRATLDGRLETSSLFGMQGTVVETEGRHIIVRKMTFGIAFGYKIELQNGQVAILERHEFIPLNDPPKQQEQEKEECLDVPAQSV